MFLVIRKCIIILGSLAMLLNLALFFFACTLCQGQWDGKCEVPVICTDDNGEMVKTWKPYFKLAPSTTASSPTDETTREAVRTTQTMTSEDSGGNNCNQQNIPGWIIGKNNFQYWISPANSFVTYSGATQICNSMNSRVVIYGARNPAARKFLVDNILSRINIHGFWIGLHETDEGVYEWNDNNSTINENTAFWKRDQPDNHNNANCVVFARYFEYRWDDVPCQGSTFGILCERYVG